MFIIEDYPWANPNRHTAKDTIATLNLDFHYNATRTLVAALADMAGLKNASTSTSTGSTTSLPNSFTTTGPALSTTTTPGAESKYACPARKALGDDAAAIDRLRAFRGRLAKTSIGRRMIRSYYENSEWIDAALDSSPLIRAAARVALKAVVLLAEDSPGYP